ncbi:MAG: hypothetical protein R3B56_01105 [Candidatus Scalinduaceae bacterium]
MEIRFLENLEQAIGKSALTAPEREMWLSGIKQMRRTLCSLKQ